MKNSILSHVMLTWLGLDLKFTTVTRDLTWLDGTFFLVTWLDLWLEKPLTCPSLFGSTSLDAYNELVSWAIYDWQSFLAEPSTRIVTHSATAYHITRFQRSQCKATRVPQSTRSCNHTYCLSFVSLLRLSHSSSCVRLCTTILDAWGERRGGAKSGE